MELRRQNQIHDLLDDLVAERHSALFADPKFHCSQGSPKARQDNLPRPPAATFYRFFAVTATRLSHSSLLMWLCTPTLKQPTPWIELEEWQVGLEFQHTLVRSGYSEKLMLLWIAL